MASMQTVSGAVLAATGRGTCVTAYVPQVPRAAKRPVAHRHRTNRPNAPPGSRPPGTGIGTALFGHSVAIVALARGNGIICLQADRLPGNRHMPAILARSGLSSDRTSLDGVVHVEIPIADHRQETGSRTGHATRLSRHPGSMVTGHVFP